MKKAWGVKQTGFTIVELLIVIVVIAILAVITIVAYNGIQQRATNTRFLAAIDTYEKAFRMYYADNGSYPETIVNSVCLGNDYAAVGGFNQDSCTGIATGVSTTTSPAINQILQKYISTLPSVADVVFNLNGQPFTRGIWYGADSHYAAIGYYINGDQACGRGTKQAATVSGAQITQCQLVLVSP